MTASKVGLDVAAGVGLSEVNNLDVSQSLILNGLIILGRIVLEFIQNRREKKRKRKEAKEVE
jgi:hypothetical protein